MEKLKGTDLHMGTYTDGVFSQFAFAKRCSVAISRSMIGVASPTSGYFEDCIPGRISWTMSVGCLLSNDESAVYNAFKNGTLLTVAFVDETSGTQTKKKMQGTAYIKSLKIGANLHEMATFEMELQGTGELSYTDA